MKFYFKYTYSCFLQHINKGMNTITTTYSIVWYINITGMVENKLFMLGIADSSSKLQFSLDMNDDK